MRKSKIFVTGGKGMLASEIESFYREKGCDVCAPTSKELNVVNAADVQQLILSYKPDYIFHTAAIFPDFCEDHQEVAFKINGESTKTVAQISQKTKRTFIYISTCGLFGDEIKYYSERDQVVLKTIYARSKYLGETLAAKECQNTYIIRPGWLFGGNKYHKRNFVYQRYKEALRSPTMYTAGDKHGSPTYTGDLVTKIDEVLESNRPGTYHITNQGGGTRAEYVKKILESFKLNTKLEIVDSSYFPRKANVPNCEMLQNENITSLGLKPLPPWQEAIEKYVHILMKEN